MKWTVVWSQEAENELTNIWLNAWNRKAVSSASDQIDAELHFDADRKGMPFGTQRIIHIRPLLAVYEVIPDDCLVRVVTIIPETN